MRTGSLDRIFALVMRHWYLLAKPSPRLVELFMWPTVELMIWGFMCLYLGSLGSGIPLIGQMALSGATLWMVFARGQTTIMISFLEEIWSRNLGHIFVSPITAAEFTLGVLLVAMLRSLVGMLVAVALSVVFFGSTLLSIGPVLALHWGLLMVMCSALGMANMGLMLRYGPSAEWLMWMFGFILLPISCAYYPLAVLPAWLQPVALALPMTHVFESMRSVMATGDIQSHHLMIASALTVLYIGLACIVMARSLNYARQHAGLVQQGS